MIPWKGFPIPLTKTSKADFDFSFDVSLNKRLNNQSSAVDLRRHGGPCDVTVMKLDQLRAD